MLGLSVLNWQRKPPGSEQCGYRGRDDRQLNRKCAKRQNRADKPIWNNIDEATKVRREADISGSEK
jgi:hypothetical protein